MYVVTVIVISLTYHPAKFDESTKHFIQLDDPPSDTYIYTLRGLLDPSTPPLNAKYVGSKQTCSPMHYMFDNPTCIYAKC